MDLRREKLVSNFAFKLSNAQLVPLRSGAREEFVSGGVLGGIFGGMGGATGMAKWKVTPEQQTGARHHTVLSMTTVTLTQVLDEAKALRLGGMW